MITIIIMYYIVNIFIIQAFPTLSSINVGIKAMLKEFALSMSTCIDKLYTTYILQRCLQITGWSLGKKLERFS